MKNLIVLALSLLIISCSDDKIIRTDDVQFIDRYVEIGNSLFAGNGLKTSFQAKKTVQELQKLKSDLAEKDSLAEDSHLEKVISYFKDISETRDIEEQRKIFSKLTELAKNSAQKVHKDLYLQYCPMAFDNTGAEWISDKKAIENPYFGSAMPNCGKTKEEYKNSKD